MNIRIVENPVVVCVGKPVTYNRIVNGSEKENERVEYAIVKDPDGTTTYREELKVIHRDKDRVILKLEYSSKTQDDKDFIVNDLATEIIYVQC